MKKLKIRMHNENANPKDEMNALIGRLSSCLNTIRLRKESCLEKPILSKKLSENTEGLSGFMASAGGSLAPWRMEKIAPVIDEKVQNKTLVTITLVEK